MKKFFGIHSKEEEDVLVNKLITLSNVDHKYVNLVKVHVSDTDFIHVTIIDDTRYKNKKDLVLIHGLAGSSLNFFKLFKRLSENFVIYAVDLPGMGLSSRHMFEGEDFHVLEEYFIGKLKKCFNTLNLKKFYLMGHSFGGYMSGLYTMKYSSEIIQLILISPVGLSAKYKEIVSSRMEDFLQEVCFKIKKTPNSLLKIFAGANFLFDFLCDKTKFRGLESNEEFITHRDFINIVLRNQGSENAVFAFFDKNLRAYKPLSHYSELLKDTNIHVLYGDSDWCPKEHAEDLKYHLPDNVKIDTVSDSGHFLYTDNYEELLDKIYDNLKGKRSTEENSKSVSTIDEEIEIKYDK